MNLNRRTPPRFAHWLLTKLHPDDTLEEVEGDLDELYEYWYDRAGPTQATLRYLLSVVSVLPPFVRRRKPRKQPSQTSSLAMLSNYLKIAWRTLAKHKVYSAINILGLSTGMAVALLIGLWVYDELTFNRQFKNHDRLAKLWQFVKFDVEKASYDVLPIPLAHELRSKYPDIDAISLSVTRNVVLATGETKLMKTGNYVEPDFFSMMSMNLLAGSDHSLTEVNSILVSKSLATTLFGTANPLNQIIRVDNKRDVKVAGVYEDFPANSAFNDVFFLAPWKLFLSLDANARRDQQEWDSNSYQIFTQLKPGADFDQVSAKIKDIRVKRDNPPAYKPEFFMHPMSKWHLYSDFKDGVNTGGMIKFVWLFGAIGLMVLLLACINFMNLSTARSEKRAKEVGIRKAIGSVRSQLISQFFSESLLMAGLAFLLAITLAQLALPFFNKVAEKELVILWANPWFWLVGVGFSLFTGLIAGSYPALYLSSFSPIKVLKGTGSKISRFAAIPRRVLVSFQFTVSIALIIGTIIVFQQIKHAKNRPVGYSRSGLIEINMNSPKLAGQYHPLRNALLNTGAVAEMAESSFSVTVQYDGTTDIAWKGKTPGTQPLVMRNSVTHDFGKTVGWQLKEGRDFSRSYSTDTSAMILNESAVKLMGFQKPVGERIRHSGKEYTVIGVVKDMIKEDPFKPVSPSFFRLHYRDVTVMTVKLAPQMPTSEALAKVGQVFKNFTPDVLFDYKFVDEIYARKFGTEERIGKLAGGFSSLAILISCLGLFGLASYVAEQRTKEIGIRKVLGASVFMIWQLLSKEFVLLVLIAFCLAAPLAYYVLGDWLQNYQYRIELSWWIFAAAGLGALVVTLLTVSFQSVKTALMNPVKSLRSE